MVPTQDAYSKLIVWYAQTIRIHAALKPYVLRRPRDRRENEMIRTMMACGHVANATSEGKPSCVICLTTEQAAPPNLEGRMARCYCKSVKSSSFDLAFFEFKGEGSPQALSSCKHCHYHFVAHRLPKNDRPKFICDNFEANGAFEYDSYYCGCRGWD